VFIRVDRQLVEGVRQRFPELRDVSDADIVRIALRKLMEG